MEEAHLTSGLKNRTEGATFDGAFAARKTTIVAFRRHTLLPLDDCLYAFQPTIPHLTRSSLHRCLQRLGISRLPSVEGDKQPKKRFKSYAIGYFHIDIAEVQTAEGKLYLFVAIDRTSKYAFVELYTKAGKMNAAQFLRNLVATVPYTIHTVLTDNGIQFTNRSRDLHEFQHIFDRVCTGNGIEHRLTKVKHPRTNGQVERMNRTIKDATVIRFHYDDHEQLQKHLAVFIDAYNFARRLKTLRGLTPYEFICKKWTEDPERFKMNPIHQIPGPNKTLKEMIPSPLEMAKAEFSTIRLRLLKIAVRVQEFASRIGLAYAAGCPEADLFTNIANKLRAPRQSAPP
ncbi:Transposase DDE domain group 1 [Cohaesibacter sp. ES.047]|nr:Transposase DDE domain group 1 [Cohaesibacter sp. ES.047]